MIAPNPRLQPSRRPQSERPRQRRPRPRFNGRPLSGHEAMFRRRFFVCLALAVPVLYYSTTLQSWLGFAAIGFTGSEFIAPAFGDSSYSGTGRTVPPDGGRRGSQPGARDDATDLAGDYCRVRLQHRGRGVRGRRAVLLGTRHTHRHLPARPLGRDAERPPCIGSTRPPRRPDARHRRTAHRRW